MNMSAELLAKFAARMRRLFPDAPPQDIAQGLGQMLAMSEEEHLAWAQQCSDRDYAAREANARARASQPQAQRPAQRRRASECSGCESLR